MDMVATTGATSRAKLQSNHHHQQTNTKFFTGRMPFLSPNQQHQSTNQHIIVTKRKWANKKKTKKNKSR